MQSRPINLSNSLPVSPMNQVLTSSSKAFLQPKHTVQPADSLHFGLRPKTETPLEALPEQLDNWFYQTQLLSALFLWMMIPLRTVREKLEAYFVGGSSRKVCTLNDAPKRLQNKIEELHFTTPAGNKNMYAWFLPPKAGKPTIVLSHGRNRNMDKFNDYLSFFAQKGYGVAVYDLRGYGRNKGLFNAQGAFDDLEGLSQHLETEKDIPPNEQIVMGWSLGGAITAEVAAQHEETGSPFKGVILMSTFSSMGYAIQMLKDQFKYKPLKRLFNMDLILEQPFESVARMESLQKTPVLILHGLADQTCPSIFATQLRNHVPNENKAVDNRPYKGQGHWIDPKLTMPDIHRFIQKST